MPREFSVCEKSKLTSLGPDFLQTELLWREQGEVPHLVVLASLSHASKIPPLGLKWALFFMAELRTRISCSAKCGILQGEALALREPKHKLLNPSDTTMLLL